MKLDVWEAVSSLLKAGGKFVGERYCLINDKGHYHREDGPAVIYPDGDQFWCRDDQLHREGGPAVIKSNGEQHWYRNGKLYREDGPAAIYPDGTQIWHTHSHPQWEYK